MKAAADSPVYSTSRGYSSRQFFTALFLFLFALSGCGKSKNNDAPPVPPANIGGGYTLLVSGGTINDGTTVKGLTILATLRDSQGNGPGGAAGWTITISGPGVNPVLVVNYSDGSPSSYETWWWDNFNPQSGTYTAKL